MQKINLAKLIADHSLDQRKLAQILYPSNSYPDRALERHVKLNLELTESQICNLSEFTGIPISNLFTGEGWEPKNKENVLWEFTCDNYKAVLDPQSLSLKVFESGELIHEAILPVKGKPIVVREFLTYLDEVVQSHKKSLKN